LDGNNLVVKTIDPIFYSHAPTVGSSIAKTSYKVFPTGILAN